mmetsp:Transcript_3320/g.20685  ORF Transcript_3320/g.20685 Transcript_3320/m.20685 type:complete len:134 (+) Transcript_3320:1277-1678(+)
MHERQAMWKRKCNSYYLHDDDLKAIVRKSSLPVPEIVRNQEKCREKRCKAEAVSQDQPLRPCTDDALCTLQIVSPNKLATLKTVSCGKEFSTVGGMELVTMTSWNTPLERRSTAGGEKTACVQHAMTSLAPCS